MKRHSLRLHPTVLILTTILLMAACASPPITAPMASPLSAPAADSGGDAASVAEIMTASDGVDMDTIASEENSDAAADDTAYDNATAGSELSLQASGLQNRKIIREATIQLEAEDVTTALNQATALSVRVGGYTMGSTSWQEAEDRQFASFSFAVPVTRFEEAVEQARRLGKVTSENITSQDVTAQFVDVEARINNLEATAERVRGFLADAQDLKYILEVNRELSRIEGDLESLKGQQNVLKQRTSFSRIYLDITPPPVVPTTAEVLETVRVWSPLETFNSALDVLVNVAKAGADVAIWLAVIGLPIAIIVWVIWKMLRRVLFDKLRKKPVAAS